MRLEFASATWRWAGPAAVALLALAPLGCKSSSKTPEAFPVSRQNAPKGGGQFWEDTDKPVSARDADTRWNPVTPASINGPGGNDPEVAGILAGRLLDSNNRPPATGYIQVVAVGDNSASGAAIEVETANQGHFYIRGLQPGRTYELIARAKSDGRMLAGRVQVQPPDVKILIPISEDYQSGSVPPIPAGPKSLPPKGKQVSPKPNTADPFWKSDSSATPIPAAELGPPRSGDYTATPQPEQIAEIASVSVPRASIPSASTEWTAPAPAAPVCRVVGNRIEQLSLYDPEGRVWDWSQRRGKLVLIDFWGTWCMPCLQAIPEVARLQTAYGNAGLEVIGIACEQGPSVDNLRRVRDVRRKVQTINYRILLADEPERDPVRREFRITSYPTLILADADGTLLWRGNPAQSRELEQILKRRLQ